MTFKNYKMEEMETESSAKQEKPIIAPVLPPSGLPTFSSGRRQSVSQYMIKVKQENTDTVKSIIKPLDLKSMLNLGKDKELEP